MPAETYAKSITEATLETPYGPASITRYEGSEPTDRVFRRAGSYWIDTCLTFRPEETRGCYREHWGPHRYERLGEIFLVPPGEALHVRSGTLTVQRSIVCEIEAAAVSKWLDGDMEWTGRRLASGLDITNPHIRSTMYRLAEEARRPGRGSEALAAMLAGQLAIEVARYCQAISEGPVSGGLASWRLRLIDERLDEPGAPPSLGDLAKLCNISKRQLTRGFAASRGCSIGDHIAATRIDLAKRQLATDESIKAIAYALGFSSPSSFSYAFRRATGSTPRQFRTRQLGATR